MSFVALGGEGLRPTFFELVAAERLMPSLKSALVYSLSVAAQRRPALHRLLDREDELMFFVSLLLDRQALAATGGSFAEGLYGLRRAAVAPADLAKAAGQAGSSRGTGAAQPAGMPRLTASERQMSLILLTLVPFLRAKLDSLYHRQLARQQAQQLQLLTPSHQLQPGPSGPPGGGGGSGGAAAWRQRARAVAIRAFLAVYPWAHAAHEGARFAYQLLYLLGRTPYYSPELHLAGLQVVRLTGQEAMQQERAVQQRRGARLARLRAGGEGGGAAWLWSLLRRGWARAGYAVADHSRSALILAVFAFKLLEWWYSSAEAKLGDQKALPPPPPPPPLLPAPGGLALPPDVTLCPLCRRRRTNPAMLATSGYVFCYPCIHREVSEHGRCPVTHVPARLDHVRRLYQGT